MSNIKISAKERNTHSLPDFISVPKPFLSLPIFNTTKTESVLKEIRIEKYSKTIRNVEINIAKMTVFSDLELFLFLLRKAIRCNSNCFEFSTNEMMNELEIESNQRPSYFKVFSTSMKNLSKLHVSFEIKESEEWKNVFFSFVSGKLSKSSTRVEISSFFIEYFNDLMHLYEIDKGVLKNIKSEYQRIMYLLYVCNRKNKINRFHIDFLKDRFQFNDLKMEDKKFIYKIRQANKELQSVGLISSFKEVKDGRKTIAFDVEYTYSSLYKRKKIDKKKDNKKEEDATDFSGFENTGAFDYHEDEVKIETVSHEEDDEYYDDQK
ncbi:TPA: hypothetical protein ACRNDK_002654 [Pseudomonas aeruginosa]